MTLLVPQSTMLSEIGKLTAAVSEQSARLKALESPAAQP